MSELVLPKIDEVTISKKEYIFKKSFQDYKPRKCFNSFR